MAGHDLADVRYAGGVASALTFCWGLSVAVLSLWQLGWAKLPTQIKRKRDTLRRMI
jgi:hypothetical protein